MGYSLIVKAVRMKHRVSYSDAFSVKFAVGIWPIVFVLPGLVRLFLQLPREDFLAFIVVFNVRLHRGVQVFDIDAVSWSTLRISTNR